MILLVSVAMAVVARHVFSLAKRLLSEFSVALVIPLHGLPRPSQGRYGSFSFFATAASRYNKHVPFRHSPAQRFYLQLLLPLRHSPAQGVLFSSADALEAFTCSAGF